MPESRQAAAARTEPSAGSAPSSGKGEPDPLIGRTLHPGPVIRLNGESPEDVVRWTGPAVGAHTDLVLHTLLGLPRETS